MRFSIVIPSYNSVRVLKRCLEAIAAIDYPDFETILVDDGSTDDTAGLVRQYPAVRYIRQDNQGPAAARNNGAAVASGELIFFTDADCVPPPDILSRYASCFMTCDIVGLGGGYRTRNIESPVARYVGREIQFRHQQARPGRTKAFGTYNCVFKKDVFLSAKGFDTGFKHASGEDFDFCYRLVAAGYRLGFDPDIFVYHDHPDRIMKYLRQQYKRGTTRTRNIFRHGKTAVADNYVEKSVKWQPPLLAGAILGAGLAVFQPAAGLGLILVCAGLLLLSNLPFYRFVSRTEPGLLPLTLLLTFLRPAAWSLGIIKYFVAREQE